MKNLITFFLSLAFSLTLNAQKNTINLNFETIENGFPKDWNVFGEGSGIVMVSNKVVMEGKSAMYFENQELDGFKALALDLPQIYAGKSITLSGFIKTENVSDGFAGLWMRIDPNIAFENMQSRGITGTTNWKKYEITLKIQPELTDKIVIGALLTGKGKMWVDDLHITVDGKDITDAKIYQKVISKAELDKEFDTGSGITKLDLSAENINNLKTLGLIWGYLKYYHPNASTGNINWDYELFRIIAKIKDKNATERDHVLSTWIKSLGEFKTVAIKIPYSDVKIEPDLQWITNSGLSAELSSQLLKIKDAKRKDTNYYIEFESTKNPLFTNENAYKNIKFPDQGYQLLSLFRYWNMIQYYFPYKNLIEEDWKVVLEEFIPKFATAKDKTAYTLATLEIIARIHDTHANIWNSPELLNYYGQRVAAAQIAFIGDQAVVKDYYPISEAEPELLRGDVITEINGKKVSEIIRARLKFLPASNYPTQLRNLSHSLLKSDDETMSIKFLRDGKIETKVLKTYAAKDIREPENQNSNYFKMLNPEIAYFDMGSINSNNFNEVFSKIKTTKGLVIDLRNYPSEFVVFKLGKFLKPNFTPFVKFTNTTNTIPGQFKFTSPMGVPGSSNYYQGKIAILINENTQSQAEYTTMAFRTAPNSKVFGSTTAGADGNVSYITLPGGISTSISGIGVYYPDGKETQRVGILPDVEVKQTIQGIKEGNDEVLDQALKWINE